jgi:hypothetical protein
VSAAVKLTKAAERLLIRMTGESFGKPSRRKASRRDSRAGVELMAGEFATRRADGRLVPTPMGRDVARRLALATAGVDGFAGQHLTLSRCQVDTPQGRIGVLVDEGESPLAWLARRTGRDGKALISPIQLLAGERLRADFTRAHMLPRTTSNWSSQVVVTTGGLTHPTEAMVAARQRVNAALVAVGPEFSGLLVDVCCFLKGLADVERERIWPPRSAKVVLQLGLDRLARHYGIGAEARGPATGAITTWLAADAEFRVE